MRRFLCVFMLICVPIAAQEIPQTTALSGNPFFVKKTWYIGGVGNWDYLTIDPAARRLYVPHESVIQVVNLDSGDLIAQISGFEEAHSIALDDTGTYAYVSDGKANTVDVVDRRRLEIESTIPTHCSPRSIAFEPGSGLVFAICGATAVPPPKPSNRPGAAGGNSPRRPAGKQEGSISAGISYVVVIDTGTKSAIAEIAVAGDFRFAQSDGDGHVYVSVGEARQTWEENGRITGAESPRRIARLDGAAIASTTHEQLDAQSGSTSAPNEAVHIDWSRNAIPGSDLSFIPLRADCANPQGLAVDSQHLRLFLACDNQRLLILNAANGDVIASLTTGPGDDVLGYDHDRSLIFVANGVGYGSLTIIRQDATTDTYEVIQNLPTRERARTLAVDSSTGEVYLVTDYHGVDLTKPGTIGTLRSTPVNGSFQVLVVAH